MGLKQKLIIKSLIGAVIGMIICVAFMVFYGDDMNDRLRIIIQLIGGGIYGAIANGGSVAYDIESWSILKATFTHYLTTMTAFVVASLSLGWFSNVALVIAVVFLTIGYVIIWLIEYFTSKKTVREINEALQELKKEESEKDGSGPASE